MSARQLTASRLAEDGSTTISTLMNGEVATGAYELEIRDRDGNKGRARLAVKYNRLHVCPPIGKQDAWPELDLTVI